MEVKSFSFQFNDVASLSGHILDVRAICNPLNVSKGMVVTDGDLRAQAMLDPVAAGLVNKGIKFLIENPEATLLVGCDYGRHRSVAVANAIAENFGIVAEHLSPGSNGKTRATVI